jgi:hypothetical protein
MPGSSVANRSALPSELELPSELAPLAPVRFDSGLSPFYPACRVALLLTPSSPRLPFLAAAP